MHNKSTSISEDELKKLIEELQFETMKELQTFLDLYNRERIATPREAFHWLSPEEMTQMLNAPFESPSLVKIPEVLDQQPEAPILTLFGLLKEGIGEKGLKATRKGTCREIFAARRRFPTGVKSPSRTIQVSQESPGKRTFPRYILSASSPGLLASCESTKGDSS